MNRFADLVSPAAREMSARFPQPRALAESNGLIRLDSNENPFGPSPRAMEAMQRAIAGSNFYPDHECLDLRRKLADRHGLSSEQILITAGSTEMLSLLSQMLLGRGLNAVTSQRSFIVYAMVVCAAGARLLEIPTTRADGFDLDAILSAVDSNTRLVFIANPNNPTGTVLDAVALDRFLARLPAHVTVVLDEAYCDFAADLAAHRNVAYPRSIEYIRRNLNVVVLRTFSKAHGLAGLRIGYALGPAELLSYCARLQNMYSVSNTAQAAASAALDDRDHIDRAVSNNTAQAESVAEVLSGLGCRVVPTFANFLYFEMKTEAATIANRVFSEGIAVRPLAAWGSPNAMRASIGTPEQNQRFLAAMRKVTLNAI